MAEYRPAPRPQSLPLPVTGMDSAAPLFVCMQADYRRSGHTRSIPGEEAGTHMQTKQERICRQCCSPAFAEVVHAVSSHSAAHGFSVSTMPTLASNGHGTGSHQGRASGQSWARHEARSGRLADAVSSNLCNATSKRRVWASKACCCLPQVCKRWQSILKNPGLGSELWREVIIDFGHELITAVHTPIAWSDRRPSDEEFRCATL